MKQYFDIDYVFFTAWGYSMSYLEFFGVVSGVAGVWLASVANAWTWPVGLVNVTLSFFLFYQVQLYPDMLLQVFYFGTGLLGWWQWTHPRQAIADTRHQLRVSHLAPRDWLLWVPVVVTATMVLGTFARNLHLWLPVLFSKPSAFAYTDSFTTVASVVATFWMIRKKVECWYAWIVIDALGAYMYFIKEVRLYSLLYVVFCFLAMNGAVNWIRIRRRYAA